MSKNKCIEATMISTILNVSVILDIATIYKYVTLVTL
jgi:hypothetical protein